MLPPELTRAAPKAPGSFDRSVPLEQTLALIPQLRERYGITRIADITHLDRIGIPVMSAIVPDSPDIISVYNGKGPTCESALAGAVMEAVERQIAAAPPIATFTSDARSVLAAIDLQGRERTRAQGTLDVAEGVDLLSGEPMLVPLAMVQSPWWGERVVFTWSSNGLAAGNTLAEATYHALSELIERHLWAIAHARGYLRPRAIVARFAGAKLTIPGFVDDSVALEISRPTGSAVVDRLIERIESAGLAVHLRAFEAEPLPVLFVATISDHAGGPSATHGGRGCSLSPEHAAIRALTEAAQSRASDFLGAREDLYRHDARDVPEYGIRRRSASPRGRWFYDVPAERRALTSFADRSSSDVGTDVELLVSALQQTDAGRVVIVDLSPPNVPFHVVRAIAPRLENPSDRYHGPAVRNILTSVSPLTT